MALFSECSLRCARKVLDTADIVREARSEPGYLCSGNLSTIHYSHNPAGDSAHMRTRASGSIPVDLI